MVDQIKQWKKILNKAYKYYNRTSFNSDLPPCSIQINTRLRHTIALTDDKTIEFAWWYLSMLDIKKYKIEDKNIPLNQLLLHEMVHIEQGNLRCYKKWEKLYNVSVKGGRGWHDTYFRLRCKDVGVKPQYACAAVDNDFPKKKS